MDPNDSLVLLPCTMRELSFSFSLFLAVGDLSSVAFGMSVVDFALEFSDFFLFAS